MNLISGTMTNHGKLNMDGSKRDHCCGCWNVYETKDGEKDENKVEYPHFIAICNECGEIRNMGIAIYPPDRELPKVLEGR